MEPDHSPEGRMSVEKAKRIQTEKRWIYRSFDYHRRMLTERRYRPQYRRRRIYAQQRGIAREIGEKLLDAPHVDGGRRDQLIECRREDVRLVVQFAVALLGVAESALAVAARRRVEPEPDRLRYRIMVRAGSGHACGSPNNLMLERNDLT